MQAGHGGGHVHPGQNDQYRELGAIAIGDAKQLVQPETHLGCQETDRADGSRHHGNDAKGVNHPTQLALNSVLTKHRIQQGSRLQRFALIIVSPAENQCGQRAEHGPGKEAPVSKRLRHGGSGGRSRSGFGIKRRWCYHKVIDRFPGGEKHPSTGQQCTHDH